MQRIKNQALADLQKANKVTNEFMDRAQQVSTTTAHVLSNAVTRLSPAAGANSNHNESISTLLIKQNNAITKEVDNINANIVAAITALQQDMETRIDYLANLMGELSAQFQALQTAPNNTSTSTSTSTTTEVTASAPKLTNKIRKMLTRKSKPAAPATVVEEKPQEEPTTTTDVPAPDNTAVVIDSPATTQ